jgi:hypothetical protein
MCDRVLSHGLVNLLWPTSGESVLYCSVYYLMYATFKKAIVSVRQLPKPDESNESSVFGIRRISQPGSSDR